MRKYDLIVVSAEAFPNGQAATNRMLSYLTGIADRKKVLYLCLAGAVSGDWPNKEKKGRYQNIDFLYMGNPHVDKLPSKPVRALKLYWRHLKLYLLLVFRYSAKSVLVYSSMHSLTKHVMNICHSKGIRVYRDVTELFGDKYSKDETSLKIMKNQAESFDGLLAISHGIYSFFDNIPESRKYYLPVLVDMSRFNTSVESRQNLFFCCSGANLERDGLLDCLNGFLLFNEKHPGFIFEIASSINVSDPYHRKCKDIIDAHLDCIHWLGPIPSFEIPGKLAAATALMLTPHREYQTKGFPTKLGEYLASGTPTICSSIEDLKEIHDCKVVYSVQTNSPEQIANRLELIVDNIEEATALGLNARSYMERNYTINAYIGSLISFFRL